MNQNFIPLKSNNDFRRIYRKGKSFVSPGIVCYITKNRIGANRIGITTSKKIGNAVQRNRSKRVIRAAYRNLLPQIKNNNDFIFVARSKTPYLKSTVVQKMMLSELKSAGLIRKSK